MVRQRIKRLTCRNNTSAFACSSSVYSIGVSVEKCCLFFLESQLLNTHKPQIVMLQEKKAVSVGCTLTILKNCSINVFDNDYRFVCCSVTEDIYPLGGLHIRIYYLFLIAIYDLTSVQKITLIQIFV